jgi:hypothetical protein
MHYIFTIGSTSSYGDSLEADNTGTRASNSKITAGSEVVLMTNT